MIQWDYSIERQTQMPYLQMSGGLTGAGTRHNTILCKQSEVVDTLRQAQDFTHVMICSVGMIFVMTKIIKGWPVTAISDFKEFAKGISLSSVIRCAFTRFMLLFIITLFYF